MLILILTLFWAIVMGAVVSLFAAGFDSSAGLFRKSLHLLTFCAFAISLKFAMHKLNDGGKGGGMLHFTLLFACAVAALIKFASLIFSRSKFNRIARILAPADIYLAIYLYYR